MKPLYWTRIVTPKPLIESEVDAGSPVPAAKAELWQELEEAPLDNLDEFTELFSRQVVAPKIKEKIEKKVKIPPVKILNSKRSQNVGIIARKLNVDFSEIEFAIYHFDTSIISLESLQQIKEIEATADELKAIKEAANGPVPLDKPEEFLLKISNISSSAERISCIVFQEEFEEALIAVHRNVETVNNVCKFLMENQYLKSLFSIILTLGNYMNGGNRTRGQADGFDIEILGKLKDVKSKDSKITLLHFIVKTHIRKSCKAGLAFADIPLPIPEPSEFDKAILIDFDECHKQLTSLQKKTDGE